MEKTDRSTMMRYAEDAPAEKRLANAAPTAIEETAGKRPNGDVKVEHNHPKVPNPKSTNSNLNSAETNTNGMQDPNPARALLNLKNPEDPIEDEFQAMARASLAPLPSRAVDPRCSAPGAFPVTGREQHHGDHHVREVVHPSPRVAAMETNVEILMEQTLTRAEPVPDFNTEVPLARALEEDDGKRKDRQASMRRQHLVTTAKFVGAGLAFLLVVVVVVIPVLLSKSNDDSAANAATQGPSIAALSSSTPAPAPTLQDRVMSLLPKGTQMALQQRDTPQSQAFQWIVQDLSLSNHGNYSDGRILQRYALATIYYSTGGPDWFYDDHWLNHSRHECDWFSQNGTGVFPWWPVLDPVSICNGTDNQDGDGVYQRIWLYSNNLHGTLPPELFLLTDLQSISITTNPDLNGDLLFSSSIGQLTALKVLDAAGMGDFGETTLPSQLGLLTNMTGLLLSFNGIAGTIPTQLGLLTKLTDLYLDENSLVGSIPVQPHSLTDLKNLYLYNNDLTGTLPTFEGLSNLLQLSMDGNQFRGTIPKEWGLFLPNLTAINLNFNSNITGPIPSQLGLLSHVDRLRLKSLSLSGSIPTQLGQLAKSNGGSMLNIDLTGTALLSGTVPDDLCFLGQNVTCPYLPWKECKLFFDCSPILCGCNCTCGAEPVRSSNNTK